MFDFPPFSSGDSDEYDEIDVYADSSSSEDGEDDANGQDEVGGGGGGGKAEDEVRHGEMTLAAAILPLDKQPPIATSSQSNQPQSVRSLNTAGRGEGGRGRGRGGGRFSKPRTSLLAAKTKSIARISRLSRAGTTAIGESKNSRKNSMPASSSSLSSLSAKGRKRINAAASTSNSPTEQETG